MAVKCKEKCKKCFHFQVCANVLQNDLFIREVMLGEKEPECKQFVEVVRCKDCKYYHTHNRSVKWNTEAVYCCKSALKKVCPDDFCSYGERKDNGSNI